LPSKLKKNGGGDKGAGHAKTASGPDQWEKVRSQEQVTRQKGGPSAGNGTKRTTRNLGRGH